MEIGSTPAKGSSSSIYFGSVAKARQFLLDDVPRLIKQAQEFFLSALCENLTIIFLILLAALIL
jgi:replication-associated recombination protein RarA